MMAMIKFEVRFPDGCVWMRRISISFRYDGRAFNYALNSLEVPHYMCSWKRV